MQDSGGHGNEPSDSLKCGELVDWLRNYCFSIRLLHGVQSRDTLITVLKFSVCVNILISSQCLKYYYDYDDKFWS